MSDSVQKYSASRMGSAPIGPLLLSCSVPMMISMLVQALYNIVDSIFVSRVNEAALSAVSLAFPIQNLMIAFAVGTAVGVNAYLSRCLGEGNRAEASRAAMNGLFLAFCGGIAFLVFGILGARAFIASQTTDAQIMQYGADYLSICTLWCMGLFLQCMLEKLLVATGRSAFAMASQLIGALINIALDPIFIFGLFGVPRMEAAGAAVATVAGQWIGAAAGLTMNLLCNKDINLTLKGFRPAGSTIKRIYAVGIPSIAMNAIGSVMTFAMNNILIAFSSTAVAVFGVYFKLQSFVFMPIFGINNGMVPIIGYNYGARQPNQAHYPNHQTGCLLCRVHYAVRPDSGRSFPTCAAGCVQRQPHHAGHGYSGLAHYCHPFSDGRFQRNFFLRVPGAGARHAGAVGFGDPPAGCAGACRLAAEPHR